jgi:hypothetical protein
VPTKLTPLDLLTRRLMAFVRMEASMQRTLNDRAKQIQHRIKDPITPAGVIPSLTEEYLTIYDAIGKGIERSAKIVMNPRAPNGEDPEASAAQVMAELVQGKVKR